MILVGLLTLLATNMEGGLYEKCIRDGVIASDLGLWNKLFVTSLDMI